MQHLDLTLTLENIRRVERLIIRHSQLYGRHQLWTMVKRYMSYKTFITILDYLLHCQKIMVCRDGVIFWTYNPGRISRLKKEGLL